MKKWLVFILLLITTAATVIPCCQSEDCCQETKATNHPPETEGTCSPFFACSTCAGFTNHSRNIDIPFVAAQKQEHHPRIVSFQLSTFTSSLLQPPRSA